jgi:biotin carboxyl carrier protein
VDSLAEYSISVGSRKRRVKLLKISSNESTALAELDGNKVQVLFQKAIGFDEKTEVYVDGKKYHISLNRNNEPMSFNVEVDGESFVLQFETKQKKLESKNSYTISPSRLSKNRRTLVEKKGAVLSPMPGKVVLVKAKIGAEVKVGDPLCILQAMKMENEIVAPRNGLVKEVKVDEGSIVRKGDILVVIE